jgi:hypothetical protein
MIENIRKANDVYDIFQVFRGEPLNLEELKEFYHETGKARSRKNPRKRISRLLRKELGTSQHMLFVGYKGCGKSTELNKLQKDISDEFLVINFSVMEELDPVHLQYIELFIVTMEQLFTKASENNLLINPSLLKRIENWTNTKEIVEIKEKYNIGLETEVGGSATLGVPYFKEFFAKFKATAKSSRSLKEDLKTNVEPKLSDLIILCNDLISEIRFAVADNGDKKKDILIIIEDLDKIPLDRAQSLFFNYINQLVQLNTNVIYTFPVALYYSLKFNEIKPYFDTIYELYMIKVYDKEGEKVTEGIDAMKAIVKARMDLAIFENEGILEKMILKSGGCLRDLFYLVREASESALDDDRETINDEDYEQSYLGLKSDYENTIADNVVDGKVKYTAQQYFETLVALAKDETKKITNTEASLHLRQNLTILGYNGENWCDVHPIVKDILEERNLL